MLTTHEIGINTSCRSILSVNTTMNDNDEEHSSLSMVTPQNFQEQQQHSQKQQQHSQQQQQPLFNLVTQTSISHFGDGGEVDLNSSEHGSMIGSMTSVGASTEHSMGQLPNTYRGIPMGMVQQKNIILQVDPCIRCGLGGGDVRINGCGCNFHTVSFLSGYLICPHLV